MGSLFTAIDTNEDLLAVGIDAWIFTDVNLLSDMRIISDATIDFVKAIAEPKTLYAHIVADYFQAFLGQYERPLRSEEILAIKTAIATIPNLEFGNPADTVGIHIKAAMIRPANFVNSATRAQLVQDMIES